MDDKYFVPDIEDIRIGYEGEINWNRAYEDKFVPFKIKIQDNDGTYTNEISDIIDALDDGYAEARTPYLTKEQIEAEGWKETSKYNYEKVDSNITAYYGNDHYLWIMHSGITVNGEEYKANSFKGECKSINEFRYICKLLKI